MIAGVDQQVPMRVLFGEMGDALLLDSTRVMPKRINDAGYQFKFTNLNAALENAVE